MGLRVIQPSNTSESSKERIIIYGRAGVGKTRLALSLTPRFGKICYYAADSNSHLLSSISDEKRDRIYVISPEGDDPIQNFTKFCLTNWKKHDPEISTLVIDTYTKVANDCIRHSANSGSVTSEKHYVIGDPNNGGQTIPNRGDYLAIESISRGFLDKLFDIQRDMNIVFICHEDIKMVEGMQAVGGPAHPGRAMTEDLPAQFSTVIRLIREQILIPGKNSPEDVVMAVTDYDGKFISKIRTKDEINDNPLGRVVVDRTATPYWEKYDSVYFKEKEAVNV